MSRPLVYIDVGVTHEADANVWEWFRLLDDLLQDGIVTPFMPFWSLVGPAQVAMDFDGWDEHMQRTIESIKFDACLRPGHEVVRTVGGFVVREATRASEATRFFDSRSVPVFRDKESLYGWCPKFNAR